MNRLLIRIGLLLAFVSVLAVASGVNTYSAVKPLHDTYVLGQTQFSPGSVASMRVIVAKAVSLASSEPAPGAKVVIELRAGDGKRTAVYEGATNQRGTLDASFRIPELAEGSYTMVVRTQSEFGRDELEREVTLRRAARILLTTDKPLYQPAQTMHIRALALNEGDLRPVAGDRLTFEVEDSKGNKVFKKAGDLSKFGIASADFVLAHEVNMGTYKVRALLGKAQAEKAVEVKRYVLPKFKVEVTTDKKFYLPGETAKGSVQSDYFFGKPVAGGKVTLKAATFDVKFNDFATLDGQTDKNGRYEFELKLPEHFVGQPLEKGDALLKLEVKVKDTADHTETVTKTCNVAKDAIRLAVIPESGKVVPGVENILYVFASYPDGEAAQAAVTLEAGERTLKGSTDASGIVEFKLTPREQDMKPPQMRRGRRFEPMPMDEGAPAMDFEVKVSAADKQGRRASVTKALSAEAAKDNILLRLSKAIYEGGERLRGEVLTTFGSGTAYLDVVKNRQTLLTQTVELSRGRADFDLPLSDDFFGTLELHAYKIMPDGQIVRDSKVVYVQPTRDLNVTVEPDKATYRPGEDAVIRFQVTDQRGRSVPSALGLIIVDESVYALQEMQPGLEKVYFTLEKELLEPKYEIEFGPAITFEDMVKVQRLEERRQTAAKVLLAKAEPPAKFAWQVNPAQARREKLDERLDKLAAALYDYAQKKPVGQLDPATKRWGYQPDLLTKLVKETDLKRGDTLDPWGNPFSLDELGQVREEFKFDNLSRLLAAQGLQKIYTALAQFKNKEERRTKERTDPWTFPDNILDELVRAWLLKKSDLIDPWGQPYVLTKLDKPNPAPHYTAQLRFYDLRSCGPDMVKGTADDVTNPYEMPLFEHRRGLAGFGGGGLMLGRPMEMDTMMPMMAAKAGQERLEKEKVAVGAGGEGPGAKPVVVREFFPETLLFQPSLITDDRGRTEQRVRMADSITTWRLTASASSLLGLLGSTTKGVTVFQDFFIDIDLPVSLTQGDQVHIPVAVYNYLKSRQRVRLVMDKGDWFQALGDTERTMDIGPGDVTVVYFPLAAKQVGAHKLTVTGYGEKMSDAIRREIEVAPDGKEALVTFSGRLAKDVRETILIPDAAIDGASKIFVKIYPGVFSQVVEGVDKILQMPNGCFEQTSSTTYPNILVLDYMKRTRQETPELRMKAEQYINLGYQRLLTFEVQGGGFSWFGDKPANKILTAWGVTEFHDMAKVFEIDENVIRRTQAWLVEQQQKDGSWKPDEHYLHAESWGRIQNSNLLATAYIANALLESAYVGSDKAKRETLKRGLDYIVSKRDDARDAYTLAFILNCLASASGTPQRAFPTDAATVRALDEVIARLLDMKKEKGEHVWWDSSVATVTHSHGPSAAIETTALVALGLIKCQREQAIVNKALGWLISQKDPHGTWHGTQATILVFKALLGSLTRQGEKVNAQVAIRVGDREEQISITPENYDVLRLVDFKDQTRKGRNEASIRVTGEGNVMYQIVGRCYLPWPKFEMPVSPPLSIDVDYDRTSLKKDDTVTCRVRVGSNLPGTCKMIMVDLGIPPGFSVLTDGLAAAVEKKTIQRFDLTSRQVMIYLDELTFGKPVEFSYQMKAKYPIRAQSPASTVYKYYNPEERATAKPVEIAVTAK